MTSRILARIPLLVPIHLQRNCRFSLKSFNWRTPIMSRACVAAVDVIVRCLIVCFSHLMIFSKRKTIIPIHASQVFAVKPAFLVKQSGIFRSCQLNPRDWLCGIVCCMQMMHRCRRVSSLITHSQRRADRRSRSPSLAIHSRSREIPSQLARAQVFLLST